MYIDVTSIDAYWLQRKFSGFFDDATISSKKAEEALEILQTPDERACENRLLLLLEVERFDLVKFLMHNRKKISYCTRLERAKNNDDEKKKIKKEMIEDASGIGTEILSELQVGGDNNNSNINAWGESDDVNAWSKNNNTWLSTSDIETVLKQYEGHHKDFKCYGALPMDFKLRNGNSCVSGDLCNINLKVFLSFNPCH